MPWSLGGSSGIALHIRSPASACAPTCRAGRHTQPPLTRLTYEEHTLNQFFPQYAIYASRTLIGIPLLWR